MMRYAVHAQTNRFFMMRSKIVAPALTGENRSCETLLAVPADCTGPISQITRIVESVRCQRQGSSHGFRVLANLGADPGHNVIGVHHRLVLRRFRHEEDRPARIHRHGLPPVQQHWQTFLFHRPGDHALTLQATGQLRENLLFIAGYSFNFMYKKPCLSDRAFPPSLGIGLPHLRKSCPAV